MVGILLSWKWDKQDQRWVELNGLESRPPFSPYVRQGECLCYQNWSKTQILRSSQVWDEKTIERLGSNRNFWGTLIVMKCCTIVSEIENSYSVHSFDLFKHALPYVSLISFICVGDRCPHSDAANLHQEWKVEYWVQAIVCKKKESIQWLQGIHEQRNNHVNACMVDITQHSPPHQPNRALGPSFPDRPEKISGPSRK